jgi:hypothetical protein
MKNRTTREEMKHEKMAKDAGDVIDGMKKSLEDHKMAIKTYLAGNPQHKLDILHYAHLAHLGILTEINEKRANVSGYEIVKDRSFPKALPRCIQEGRKQYTSGSESESESPTIHESSEEREEEDAEEEQDEEDGEEEDEEEKEEEPPSKRTHKEPQTIKKEQAKKE